MTVPLLRAVSVSDFRMARRRPVDPVALRIAAEILEDIESRGVQAVLEHAQRLDNLKPADILLHDRDSLCSAFNRLPNDHKHLLERTALRMKSFADAQRACILDLNTTVEGGHAGHTCLPVDTVGCYAPGGRFPLPSSVLMTAITARSARVPRVWVASPRPTDATLAAAHVAGADGLLPIGGVQAIAALSLGLCGVPKCDLIVGPGNKWVTAAKFLVSDHVGIDMLAGPSELVVLADDSADPAIIAADLLAQAEHDEDAVPILVTTDPRLPALLDSQLHAMLATLSTQATARVALRNGFSIVAPDLESAIAACDTIAPEHLEIITRDAHAVSQKLKNAGALFIGGAASEVFGDYGAGPNHVLPTGGTARFKSGLSVFTFLRPRSWLTIESGAASAVLRQDAAQLARIEGLEAHARAAESRK